MYNVPCHDTLIKLIHKKYLQEKEKLKKILKNVKFFCSTTDLWSNINNQHFFTMTIHYIDEYWTRCTKTLETEKLSCEHATGEEILKALMNVLQDYALKDRKRVWVTDCGSNIISALENEQRNACVCHVLNNILQKSLSNIDSLLKKCRKIVKYFKKSTVGTTKLETLQRLGDKEVKKLIQYVKTRWNSNISMLQRLLEINEEVNAVLTAEKNSELALSQTEITTIENVVALLQPFNQAINILEGEKYSTASIELFVLENLLRKVKEVKIKEDDAVAVQIQNQLILKFDKKFMSFPNPVLCAYGLDPRFRGHDSLLVNRKDVIKLLKHKYSKLKKAMKKQVVQSPPKKLRKKEGISLKEFAQVEEKDQTEDDDEVTEWFNLPSIDLDEDPLNYWRENEKRFPILSILARKYLCIVASSAPAERVFSAGGNLYTKKRAKLSPEVAKEILFLHENLENVASQDMMHYLE